MKIGDMVVLTNNFDKTCSQKVTKIIDIKKVNDKGSSGYWIKTEVNKEWIDVAWYKRVNKLYYLLTKDRINNLKEKIKYNQEVLDGIKWKE